MKFTINKRAFVEEVLIPTSKISENACLTFAFESSDGEDKATVLKTLVSSPDSSTLFLAKIPCSFGEESKCIIPDCKTFLRLFSGIDTQEDLITLEILDNVIKFESPTYSFKYHLLDESYVSAKKSISEEKLNQLSFDTTFEMTRSKFSDLLKFNSIIPDIEKLYFSTRNNKVYAKLGDEQKSNTNEITTDVSSQYGGEPFSESMPVNIQSMLLMSFSANSIELSVNQKLKIFAFKSGNIKYIVSGLVK